MAHWQPDITRIISLNKWIPDNYRQDFVDLLKRLQGTLKESEFRELAARLEIPSFCRKYWNIIILYRLRTADLMTVELSSPKFNEIIHKYDKTARLLASDLAATFPDDTVTRWQKIFLDHAQHDFWDRPPQPKPMKNNPRKLDWTSVWEWKQKHPGITDEKIAELLHYNRVTITRKLNEFARDK